MPACLSLAGILLLDLGILLLDLDYMKTKACMPNFFESSSQKPKKKKKNSFDLTTKRC
jgi:hypothetical protein